MLCICMVNDGKKLIKSGKIAIVCEMRIDLLL